MRKQIEAHRALHDGFPSVINDCPAPSSGNMCLNVNTHDEIRYSEVVTNSYSGSGGWVVPGYEIAIMGEDNFAYSLKTEQRGRNEFLRLVDIAPYIDR